MEKFIQKFKFTGKEVALSFQHLFAMFGATVLVPLLTGLSPSVALLSAGLGTLLFHCLTKFKVPVFLGSSFAFIPGIAAVVNQEGLQYAQGGIIIAGAIYVALAVTVYFIGVERVKRIFPPVVTGPIIVLIGLGLTYAAMNDARDVFSNSVPEWISVLIALFTITVTVVCMLCGKKVLSLVPVLIGICSGYLLCVILKLFGINVIDFDVITSSPWFNIPYVTEGFVTLPKFSWTAILVIAPVALVTCMEHIGDIMTNGTVVGQDFMKSPGLHRTLLGDGLATSLAGFLGGPSNTTYSENTAVLAATKNYNPRLMRLTAVIAILLAFFGKFGAVIQTIPTPVKGGVEIILFGMIAAVGIRTMFENKVDFSVTRNVVIATLILSIGIGTTISTYAGGSIAGIPITDNFALSPLFLSTIVGIIANLILPKEKTEINKATPA
ncbi:MAG: uracil-xanthine permease family protein [Christensenellaceae bacterium]|jgi:uracil permease|nr:uracil-xanthine permease family protein [Christensenellaceae bacterium]